MNNTSTKVQTKPWQHIVVLLVLCLCLPHILGFSPTVSAGDIRRSYTTHFTNGASLRSDNTSLTIEGTNPTLAGEYILVQIFFDFTLHTSESTRIALDGAWSFDFITSTWPEDSGQIFLYSRKEDSFSSPSTALVNGINIENSSEGIEFLVAPPYATNIDLASKAYSNPNGYVFDYASDAVRKQTQDIIGSEKDPLKQALLVHDWLTSNLFYDRAHQFDSNNAFNDPDSVLKHRVTICDGYTNLFEAMLRSLGIPCRKVFGDVIYGTTLETWENENLVTTNHTWNEFWIEERWVAVDVTWNSLNYADADTGELVSLSPHHIHFDPTPETFATSHRALNYGSPSALPNARTLFESDRFTFSQQGNFLQISGKAATADSKRAWMVFKGESMEHYQGTSWIDREGKFTSTLEIKPMRNLSTRRLEMCYVGADNKAQYYFFVDFSAYSYSLVPEFNKDTYAKWNNAWRTRTDQPLKYASPLVKDDVVAIIAAEIITKANARTDAEKAYALYCWMQQSMLRNNGPTQSLSPRDVLSAVDANSHELSILLQELLRSAGIPCRTFQGYTTLYTTTRFYEAPASVQHYWNEAYIDGQWVHMDIAVDIGAPTTDTYYSPNDTALLPVLYGLNPNITAQYYRISSVLP